MRLADLLMLRRGRQACLDTHEKKCQEGTLHQAPTFASRLSSVSTLCPAKKRITEAKVSKEAIELDDIEQGKVQVSEVIDHFTPIVIEGEEKKEDMTTNLQAGFHERLLKQLMQTLKPTTILLAKKGKSNAERGTPFKSNDVVLTIVHIQPSQLSSNMMLTHSLFTLWEIYWWCRAALFQNHNYSQLQNHNLSWLLLMFQVGRRQISC